MILQLDPCKTNSWNLKITPRWKMKSGKSSSKPSTTKPWLWVLNMLVFGNVHSRNLTWNLKISPWKRRFPLETIIFRFHVSFWKCNWNTNLPDLPNAIRVKVLLPPPLLRPKMLRPRWMISTRRGAKREFQPWLNTAPVVGGVLGGSFHLVSG